MLLEQRRRASRSGLLVGLPIGVIATLGLQYALGARPNTPQVVRYELPKAASTPVPTPSPAASATTPPVGVAPISLFTDAVAKGAAEEPASPPTVGGDLPKGVPLPGIDGVLPFNPMLSGAIDDQDNLPVGQPADNSLSTWVLNAGEADVDQTQRDLDKIARKAGGRATPFTETGANGQPDRQGVIVEVDPTKAPEVERAVSKSATARERFVGGSAQRQTKLEEDARMRLVALGRERSKLLEKYLDDAPEIKAIDERIESVKAEMRQIRLKKGAAIKVYIGPKE